MFQYFSSQRSILLNFIFIGIYIYIYIYTYYKLKAFDVAQIQTLPTAECHESFKPKIQFNL